MARYRRHQKRYRGRRILVAIIALAATAGVSWLLAGLFSGNEAVPANEPPAQVEDSLLSGEPAQNYEPDGGNTPPQENMPVAHHPDDVWRLILVSPSSPVGYDFTPPQLETITGHHQVDSRIAASLREMIASAESEGVALMIVSAYRPAQRQAELHNQQIERFLGYGRSQEEAVATASTIVLPPGTSEHQTGLAVDILTPDHQTFDDAFADTPAGRWLAQYSWRYGFILRYPRDSIEVTGVIYEPWHFRYVGREHAQAIFEGGYILEEYLARR